MWIIWYWWYLAHAQNPLWVSFDLDLCCVRVCDEWKDLYEFLLFPSKAIVVPDNFRFIKHDIKDPTWVTSIKVMQASASVDVPYAYTLVVAPADDFCLVKVQSPYQPRVAWIQRSNISTYPLNSDGRFLLLTCACQRTFTRFCKDEKESSEYWFK